LVIAFGIRKSSLNLAKILDSEEQAAEEQCWQRLGTFSEFALLGKVEHRQEQIDIVFGLFGLDDQCSARSK
jgi:hypothetical protein